MNQQHILQADALCFINIQQSWVNNFLINSLRKSNQPNYSILIIIFYYRKLQISIFPFNMLQPSNTTLKKQNMSTTNDLTNKFFGILGLESKRKNLQNVLAEIQNNPTGKNAGPNKPSLVIGPINADFQKSTILLPHSSNKKPMMQSSKISQQTRSSNHRNINPSLVYPSSTNNLPSYISNTKYFQPNSQMVYQSLPNHSQPLYQQAQPNQITFPQPYVKKIQYLPSYIISSKPTNKANFQEPTQSESSEQQLELQPQTIQVENDKNLLQENRFNLKSNNKPQKKLQSQQQSTQSEEIISLEPQKISVENDTLQSNPFNLKSNNQSRKDGSNKDIKRLPTISQTPQINKPQPQKSAPSIEHQKKMIELKDKCEQKMDKIQNDIQKNKILIKKQQGLMELLKSKQQAGEIDKKSCQEALEKIKQNILTLTENNQKKNDERQFLEERKQIIIKRTKAHKKNKTSQQNNTKKRNSRKKTTESLMAAGGLNMLSLDSQGRPIISQQENDIPSINMPMLKPTQSRIQQASLVASEPENSMFGRLLDPNSDIQKGKNWQQGSYEKQSIEDEASRSEKVNRQDPFIQELQNALKSENNEDKNDFRPDFQGSGDKRSSELIKVSYPQITPLTEQQREKMKQKFEDDIDEKQGKVWAKIIDMQIEALQSIMTQSEEQLKQSLGKMTNFINKYEKPEVSSLSEHQKTQPSFVL